MLELDHVDKCWASPWPQVREVLRRVFKQSMFDFLLDFEDFFPEWSNEKWLFRKSDTWQRLLLISKDLGTLGDMIGHMFRAILPKRVKTQRSKKDTKKSGAGIVKRAVKDTGRAGWDLWTRHVGSRLDDERRKWEILLSSIDEVEERREPARPLLPPRRTFVHDA